MTLFVVFGFLFVLKREELFGKKPLSCFLPTSSMSSYQQQFLMPASFASGSSKSNVSLVPLFIPTSDRLPSNTTYFPPVLKAFTLSSMKKAPSVRTTSRRPFKSSKTICRLLRKQRKRKTKRRSKNRQLSKRCENSSLSSRQRGLTPSSFSPSASVNANSSLCHSRIVTSIQRMKESQWARFTKTLSKLWHLKISNCHRSL